MTVNSAMTSETRAYWESSFIGTGCESSATDLVTFLKVARASKQNRCMKYPLGTVYGMMIHVLSIASTRERARTKHVFT